MQIRGDGNLRLVPDFRLAQNLPHHSQPLYPTSGNGWRSMHDMIRDVLHMYSDVLTQDGRLREIAGTLSRKERADRNRRVFLGWHARVLRGGRAAKPGDARWRKRVHLCQADGRTSVSFPASPCPRLWRGKYLLRADPAPA